MKTIIVTGAAGGLGSEITRQHLVMGDKVWALDLKESAEIAELSSNPNYHFIPCNIAKTEFVKDALAPVAAEIGAIDAIYACAGIFRAAERVRLDQTNLDDCGIMYEINCVGFLRVIQQLLGNITGETAILCVTSEAGSISQNKRFQEYSYCMSKAAENMACSILRNHFETLGMGTRVICMHPGWLRDAMGGKEAFNNPEQSVTTADSAKGLIGIAMGIKDIPAEDNYMDYKRDKLTW